MRNKQHGKSLMDRYQPTAVVRLDNVNAVLQALN